MDVDSSWLELESDGAKESKEKVPTASPRKRTKRPPPIPGAVIRVPPMPGEPVRHVTMEVKAEWLDPRLTEAPPKRRKSRASIAPVKPVKPDVKDKKAPPIPREE